MKLKIENSLLRVVKSIIGAALLVLLSLTNLQAQQKTGEVVVSTATMTVIVTKINHKTREVHIKTDDGQTGKFVASTDVQNLDQVKKGDQITVVYTEALAYEVKKHSNTVEGTATAGALANTGEKPAGAIAQQTTATVKITVIDTKTPSVTVKSSDGESQTIKVKDAANLNGIKVGDVVDITYVQAFAIKVDTVKK